MSIKKQLKQHIGKKATRRLYGALPWVGGVLALAAGAALRRKGARGPGQGMRDLKSSLTERKAGPETPSTVRAERHAEEAPVPVER
jgi:hypothetical protein